MNRYYVSKINIRNLKNKSDIINILENKYNKKIKDESIILTTNGYYKINDENFDKYKIIQKDSFIMNYEHFDIIGNIFQHKKFPEQFQIPIENKQIKLKKYYFFNKNNKDIFLVLEYFNNKLNDIYFLSNKDIRENNIFFLQDISSFIETLNI